MLADGPASGTDAPESDTWSADAGSSFTDATENAADAAAGVEAGADAGNPSTVLTLGNGLAVDPSCSAMPPDTFLPDAGGTCFVIEADAGVDAEACVSTGDSGAGDIGLAACTFGPVGAPCRTAVSRRHGPYCCDPFPTQFGSMRCGGVYGYRGLALVSKEQLLDSDGDGLSNLFDNCPYVANFFQEDTDNDLVGDVCDNCPYTYNPDQASMTDGGIGNACNCALPGVVVGPNGCRCEAGSLSDAGSLCGVVVTADGGTTDGG
jgi:hypothetical protein